MQWAVAAQQLPHLKAIFSFEGASDLYREFARHGGIGSDFVTAWHPLQVAAVQHGLGNTDRSERWKPFYGEKCRLSVFN